MSSAGGIPQHAQFTRTLIEVIQEHVLISALMHSAAIWPVSRRYGGFFFVP